LMRTVVELPENDGSAALFRMTQTGSRAGFRAVSLGWLARCLADTGDFEEGYAHGREAIRIAEGIDHPDSLVSACWGLGYLHAVRGDFGAAVLVLERALTTAREVGSTRQFPQVMRPLGLAYAMLGRPDDGVSLLEEALQIVESMGVVVTHASTLTDLAEAYLVADRGEEAERAVQRALGIARDLGQRADQASALRLLGDVAMRRGSISDGRRCYDDSIALAESLGMRPLAAWGRLGLGGLLRREGDAAARPALEQARASFERLAMPFWEALAEGELSALA